MLPLTLGAIWLGCFIWQLRGRAILPVHDPEFDEALGRIIERGDAAEDGALTMADTQPPTSTDHATSITKTSDVNIRADPRLRRRR